MKSKTRERRLPTMTSGQATTFPTISVASALQVEAAIATRKEAGVHAECPCQPYEDVFTFRRWIALGHCVKKGEKAIRIGSYARSDRSEEATESARLHPVNLTLFCRCQVREMDAKS